MGISGLGGVPQQPQSGRVGDAPPSTDPEQAFVDALDKASDTLINRLLNWEKNPSDPKLLQAAEKEMHTFLRFMKNHKAEYSKMAQENGWPPAHTKGGSDMGYNTILTNFKHHIAQFEAAKPPTTDMADNLINFPLDIFRMVCYLPNGTQVHHPSDDPGGGGGGHAP
ncbi:MAG: hypothetical protein ACKVOH_06815 [Chlamydiales bacterium]